MKLELAKDLLAKVMRRYPQMGKVYINKHGIGYGRQKLVPNKDVLTIFNELYGE